MFGRDWEKASGTVVQRRITSISKSKDGNAVRHEYVVEIRPQDRPDAGPSRVVVRDPHVMTYDWLSPGMGEEVAIEMHPDGTVRFDGDDPRRSRHKVRKMRRSGG